jgi:Zn-dependent protease with chaperone function
MKRLPSVLLTSIAIAVLTAAAHAQQWPVQAMLDNTSSEYIRLKDKDQNEIDRVKRDWLVRTQTITSRLANAYDLPVPRTVITKDASPNAFAGLDKNGQPIMGVNTEMLRLVGDDDDMLAAVIGHELGHLKAEHSTKGQQRSNVVGLIGLLAGVFIDVNQAKRGVDTGGLGTQLGAAGAGLVNAKFSRDQEREADDLGIDRMARAGYNPSAAPRMWEVMAQGTGGGSGLWMSTHPSHAERYQALTASATQLQPVYLAAVQQRIPGELLASAVTTPSNTNSVGWRTVGENAYSYRLLDESSIKQTDAGTTYVVAYRYKNGAVKGFERTAVADCSGKRRFEVTNQSEWNTRPFSEVTVGSLNGQEIEVACQLAEKQMLESGRSLAATGPRPADSSDWRQAAANEYSIRFVDANSLRTIDGALIYRLSYRYKNPKVEGFERTVVVDCGGKRRFEVMEQSDIELRPFKDVTAGIIRDELDFSCQIAAQPREPAAPSSSERPSTPVSASSRISPQWLSIGSDVYANRFLDTNSIKANEGAITYRIRYVNKDTRYAGYERSVVADCSAKQRFEITQQEEWKSRPFKSIFSGTAQADEVAIACRLAANR